MTFAISVALMAALNGSSVPERPIVESAGRALAQVVTDTPNAEQGPDDRPGAARSPGRRRHIWIGVALGAAAGVVATTLHCQGQDDSCTEVAPAYVLPLAGAGGLMGRFWP
jgi:hypothetical protein